MKRYLVFRGADERLRGEALRLCNEGLPWIDEVLNIEEKRCQDWFRACGEPNRSRPAIIEVEGNRIKAFARERFRWFALEMLGRNRAFQLFKLVSPPKYVSAPSEIAGPRNVQEVSLGATLSAPPKNVGKKVIGRREFLRIALDGDQKT